MCSAIFASTTPKCPQSKFTPSPATVDVTGTAVTVAGQKTNTLTVSIANAWYVISTKSIRDAMDQVAMD